MGGKQEKKENSPCFFGQIHIVLEQIPPQQVRCVEMGEAGGENMEMDSIQKVAGAEQESQERREAAAAESRRTVAEARKAAEELLEEARRQAGAETRQMLARAEADAAEETKTILAEAEQRCQALKQNARTRLDQAAKRIVEGVVKG